MLRVVTEVDGAQVSADVLAAAPMEVKQAASKEMHATARKLADAAQAGASTHPSGLWKGAGGASYRVRKKSLLSVGVATPSNAAGAAEAISEFASVGRTPQGKALVRTLNAVYGRNGTSGQGRILWRAYDDGEGAYKNAIQAVVDKYAASLEGRL